MCEAFCLWIYRSRVCVMHSARGFIVSAFKSSGWLCPWVSLHPTRSDRQPGGGCAAAPAPSALSWRVQSFANAELSPVLFSPWASGAVLQSTWDLCRLRCGAVAASVRSAGRGPVFRCHRSQVAGAGWLRTCSISLTFWFKSSTLVFAFLICQV